MSKTFVVLPEDFLEALLNTLRPFIKPNQPESGLISSKTAESGKDKAMDDLISRQKAINLANALYTKCDTGDIADLRDMIVAGLDYLPAEHPKKCEDCRNFNKTMLLIPQPNAMADNSNEHNALQSVECVDSISRQMAIEALVNEANADGAYGYVDAKSIVDVLKGLPSAQPTLYGYDIKHLELIASVLQKEDLTPERVADALTDIGRIVAIVHGEFEETLRKAVEQCTMTAQCVD